MINYLIFLDQCLNDSEIYVIQFLVFSRGAGRNYQVMEEYFYIILTIFKKKEDIFDEQVYHPL